MKAPGETSPFDNAPTPAAPYDPHTATPICPHCLKPAVPMVWQTNTQFGLTTFFHGVEGCNKVLAVQINAADKSQIQLAPGAGFRH